MIIAAKKVSQVTTHMAIAFSLMYVMSGSLALGGLAAVIEPIINVALLPLHENFWHRLRHRATGQAGTLLAAEKVSQTAFHFIIAVIVMYVATGSLALGGLAAVMEPILNVIVLPYHDRAWDRLQQRTSAAQRLAAV